MADPFDDFDRHEDAIERWKKRRPVCAYCHRHIVEDTAYELGDDIVCGDCLEDYLNEHHDIMLELAIDRAEEHYEVLTENYEEGTT